MGKDPKYVCWKASSSKSGEAAAVPANAVAQVQSTSNEGGSSDEEEDDEEEQSSNQAQVNTKHPLGNVAMLLLAWFAMHVDTFSNQRHTALHENQYLFIHAFRIQRKRVRRRALLCHWWRRPILRRSPCRL